jgi:hypothetical protein
MNTDAWYECSYCSCRLLTYAHPWPPQCFDNFGWSPLHEACNAGEVNMIQVLVDHPSTNVDSCGGFEVLQMGLTSLHDAAGEIPWHCMETSHRVTVHIVSSFTVH